MCLCMNYRQIDNRLDVIRTTGSTALGPALTICAGMIADKPMSEIVLCTDGEPNTGIGDLSRGGGEQFYTQVCFVWWCPVLYTLISL